jgi:predicted nucleic acid-binding protein
MILYLDTSCFVKLYLLEAGSEEVKRAVESADEVATSQVAEAEVRSAIARRKREGSLTAAEFAKIKRAFRSDWAAFLHVQLTDGLSASAGNLAESHGLRGFDAIHLASALSVVDGGDGETWFFSADTRLNAAARREGFKKIFPAGLA